MKSHQLRHELAHFTGCDQPYRHSLARDVLYTDGVRHFALNSGGGAYWFLDILATEPVIRKQGASFAVITLTVFDGKADIAVAADAGQPPVFTRHIEFTDAAEGEWKFYFENGMIMLPKER